MAGGHLAGGQMLFAKLRPGPGCSSPEVEANQRARLSVALIEQVAEDGYGAVTVRGLARTAAVSTRTLYRRFGNVEDCFASTYEALMAETLERVASAAREAGPGEAGLRAGLKELTRAIAERPKEAKVVLVDSYAAGSAMRARIPAASAGFERLLAATLEAVPSWTAPPLRVARAMAAGIAHVVRAPLLQQAPDDTPRDPRPGRPAADQLLASRLADWVLSLRGAPALGASNGRVPRAGTGRGQSLGPALTSDPGDERGRVLATVARLAARDGYPALTASRIRADAGVSRRSFDAHFAGVEDCFLAAIEALATVALVESDRQTADGWEGGLRRAALALCTGAARSQALARVVFIDVLAPGLEGLRCRERMIAIAAQHLLHAAPRECRPSRLAAEASVAAVWQLVQGELGAGRGSDLPQLAPTLAYILTSSA